MPLPHLSIIIRPFNVTASVTQRLPLQAASGSMRQIQSESGKDAAAIKCASRAIKMTLFMPSRATRQDGAGGFERDNASAAHLIGSKRRQRVKMAINPSPRAARLMPAFADTTAPADTRRARDSACVRRRCPAIFAPATITAPFIRRSRQPASHWGGRQEAGAMEGR